MRSPSGPRSDVARLLDWPLRRWRFYAPSSWRSGHTSPLGLQIRTLPPAGTPDRAWSEPLPCPQDRFPEQKRTMLPIRSPDRSWLSAALWSSASARPEYCADRTLGRASTAAGHRADLLSAGLERLVVTRSGRRRCDKLIKIGRHAGAESIGHAERALRPPVRGLYRHFSSKKVALESGGR